MAKIILITGGARSGKSDYAQKRAEELSGEHFFIATCPVIDEEMNDRIKRHKQDRANGLWKTIEEEINIPQAISALPSRSVCLADCLTLWVNNLMYRAELACGEFTEDAMLSHTKALLISATNHEGTVFFVSNEVGMGVVPDNSSARRYRDCVGRCNRQIAAVAEEVILVSCGLPLFFKGGERINHRINE